MKSSSISSLMKRNIAGISPSRSPMNAEEESPKNGRKAFTKSLNKKKKKNKYV